MKDLFHQLNKAFEHKIRLSIMSILRVREHCDFVTLRDLTNTTDGNLATHIKYLEQLSYIDNEKKFLNNKPNTTYFITAGGRKAFDQHVDALEQLINKLNQQSS